MAPSATPCVFTLYAYVLRLSTYYVTCVCCGVCCDSAVCARVHVAWSEGGVDVVGMGGPAGYIVYRYVVGDKRQAPPLILGTVPPSVFNPLCKGKGTARERKNYTISIKTSEFYHISHPLYVYVYV